MKRSMFISTILMVVVLVVALSTATFAWYTAQSTVTATDTTLTSGTSTSASIALSQTNNGANANGSKVTLTMSNATTVAPMVPKTAYEVNTTTYDAFTTGNFFTASVNNAGLFTSDGTPAVPSTITNVAIDAGSPSALTGFYVINTNGTTSTSATVSVTIDTNGYSLLAKQPNDWVTNYGNYYVRSGGSGTIESPYEYTALDSARDWTEDTDFYVKNDKIAMDLRVAVFSETKLVSVWAVSGQKVHYGTISANANGSGGSENQDLKDDGAVTISGTPVTLGEFAPLHGKFIQIVAWFDGVGLVVDDAGLPAVFSLAFNAA